MKRLAVVGSGISGMAAAWFLRSRFDVTLFEKDNRIGGHTHTVLLERNGMQVPVDTGFMVFNHVTYPLLTRLFRELDVETEETDMSFSVQHVPGNLEYNGGSLDLLFVQRRNLLSPRHWLMLLAIDRFNKEAPAAIEDPRWASCTLGEYVRMRGYGEDMLHRYLVPMAAAVWSSPPDRIPDFPAVTLLRFWRNHGFLGLDCRHQWHTVTGGSRNYASKLTAPLSGRIMTGCGVERVLRRDGRAILTLSDGSQREFDKVILACHADQSLALLADPTELEGRLLREFPYQANTATLHTDESFMPRRRKCWASWNYRVDAALDGGERTTVHYWMNSLQRIPGGTNHFVSLNCSDRVDPSTILREIRYEHPLFGLGAIRAQRELPSLNALSPGQTTYYAGAWFRYGFHEDGLSSALDCARAVAGEEVWP